MSRDRGRGISYTCTDYDVLTPTQDSLWVLVTSEDGSPGKRFGPNKHLEGRDPHPEKSHTPRCQDEKWSPQDKEWKGVVGVNIYGCVCGEGDGTEGYQTLHKITLYQISSSSIVPQKLV